MLQQLRGPKALRPTMAEPITPINLVFEGAICSQVTCTRCRSNSYTFDPVMDLCLDIASANSLMDALHQFVHPERLEGDNLYCCERCQSKSVAVKQMRVHEGPNTLVIALKRFGWTGATKVSRHLPFGTRLDLAPFLSPQSPERGADAQLGYSLEGLVVHQGASADSGHYYAYVRSSPGSADAGGSGWFCMDDESVRPASLQEVLAQQAYLLFYSRDRPRPAPLFRTHRLDRLADWQTQQRRELLKKAATAPLPEPLPAAAALLAASEATPLEEAPCGSGAAEVPSLQEASGSSSSSGSGGCGHVSSSSAPSQPPSQPQSQPQPQPPPQLQPQPPPQLQPQPSLPAAVPPADAGGGEQDAPEGEEPEWGWLRGGEATAGPPGGGAGAAAAAGVKAESDAEEDFRRWARGAHNAQAYAGGSSSEDEAPRRKRSGEVPCPGEGKRRRGSLQAQMDSEDGQRQLEAAQQLAYTRLRCVGSEWLDGLRTALRCAVSGGSGGIGGSGGGAWDVDALKARLLRSWQSTLQRELPGNEYNKLISELIRMLRGFLTTGVLREMGSGNCSCSVS